MIPLGSSFVSLLGQARKDNTRDIVQRTIQRFLTKETLPSAIRNPLMWSGWRSPGIKTHRSSLWLCVADSNRPTFKEVSMVQEEINRRQPIRFRMVVQRTAVDVVGPEENPTKQP